jgi:hypothetical protein
MKRPAARPFARATDDEGGRRSILGITSVERIGHERDRSDHVGDLRGRPDIGRRAEPGAEHQGS